MHFYTKKKINFLQDYLTKTYKEFFAIHKTNITGFRIDKKNGSGNYCIIFHVSQKIDKNKLNKLNIIPLYFEVVFPNGEIKKIKTDIEETGDSRLQFALCHKNLSNGSKSKGTVGVFVEDQNKNIYAITNYHVAAWDKMLNNQFEFNGSDTSIIVGNQTSNLVIGLFSNEIDVAFVKVNNRTDLNNQFLSGNYIQTYAQGPIQPNAIGQQLTVYARSKPIGKTSFLKNNRAIFHTGFRNLVLENVIMLDKVTLGGDSGSAVMIQNILLAIIVGADDRYTYAIPYYKINNFLSLKII